MNASPVMFIKVHHYKKIECLPIHKMEATPSKKAYSMHIIPRYKH